MKKLVLVAATLAMTAGSAFAADMSVKAVRAPPPTPFEHWDFAFGSALMNDYIFRGITQSNHKPSVAAYFEPRYNLNKDLQLYIGVAGESISFPNRAAAEIDVYGGFRPTIGMFAFDFGVWGYLYPGGQCFNSAAFPGSGIPGSEIGCILNGNLPNAFLATGVPGNVAKKSASLYEGQHHSERPVAGRSQRILLSELPQPRCLGRLRIDHRQMDCTKHDLRHQRCRHVYIRRIRSPVALEPRIRFMA